MAPENVAGEVIESVTLSTTAKVLIAFAVGGLCGVLIGFTIRELLNEPLAIDIDPGQTNEVDVDNVIAEVFTDEQPGD